jgi:hypothetical protein
MNDPRTIALITECRDTLAQELSAWDIDPPLHHVKQAHDNCAAWLAAPPFPVTSCWVDGPGTVTVTATGVQFESSEKVDVRGAQPSAESVEWLLAQCEEYQRRSHEAEREVLALRAALGVAKP